jgi:hypothetical protein
MLASLDDASAPDGVSFTPPMRPSFRTQAGALMLKNLRYQQKNLCGL